MGLTPTAPGTEVIGNEAVSIDVSNKADGYMTVTYHGDNPKVKLQIKYVPDEETVYTYNLQAGQSDVFLFSRGDGEYLEEQVRSLEALDQEEGTGILRPLREPARWP